MNVVAVSHGYPPEWAMGGEVSLHRTLVAVDGPAAVLTRTAKRYDIDGVKVVPIAITDVLNIFADPQPLARQLRELEATVAIGQNELSLPTVRAARLVGIPSLVSVHTPPRWGRGVAQAVREADAAMYNTRTSASQWGEPASMVVHPPVGDLPLNVAAPAGDAYTLLSNLRNKGVRPVLDLAAKMPDQRFIIVRSPAEPTHGIPNFDELVNALPNVEVHPRVSPCDVASAYLSQTRILLVPSWYETYGMSAIEAAGYGIPSVHVDTPHVREGIGEAAYLIQPLDLGMLTAGVAAIEADFERWSAGARARARFIAERQRQELERFAKWLPTHPMLDERQLRRRALTIRVR